MGKLTLLYRNYQVEKVQNKASVYKYYNTIFEYLRLHSLRHFYVGKCQSQRRSSQSLYIYMQKKVF